MPAGSFQPDGRSGGDRQRLVGERDPDTQRRAAVHGDARPIRPAPVRGRNARANCIGDPVPDGFDQTLDAWIDPAAFAPTTARTYGNCANNTVRGPGSKSMNLSIFRSIDSASRSAIELRIETFNLFNWVNYGFPAASISNLEHLRADHEHAGRTARDADGGEVLFLKRRRAQSTSRTKSEYTEREKLQECSASSCSWLVSPSSGLLAVAARGLARRPFRRTPARRERGRRCSKLQHDRERDAHDRASRR